MLDLLGFFVGLADVLLRWRFILSVAASLILFPLAALLPGFATAQAVALFVTVGVLVGGSWEDAAAAEKELDKSRFDAGDYAVFGLFALIIGAIWGAMADLTLLSLLVGLVAMLLIIGVFFWYMVRVREVLTVGRAGTYFALLAVGYGIAVFLKYLPYLPAIPPAT